MFALILMSSVSPRSIPQTRMVERHDFDKLLDQYLKGLCKFHGYSIFLINFYLISCNSTRVYITELFDGLKIRLQKCPFTFFVQLTDRLEIN